VLAVAALAALAILAANPEAVRTRLELAYRWIPAGLLVMLVVVYARHRRGGADAQPRLRLLCTFLTLGLLVALPSYGQFMPYATIFGSESTYAMPVAAVFLVWLHAEELPRLAPAARGLGLAWIVFLVIAGTALVVRDARSETTTVRGPHGALAEPPVTGVPLDAALQTIVQRTRPGEPVLLGPQLTGLYVMSGRSDPLRTLSLIPGALDGVRGEQAAIRRMGGVRLAIIDRRPFTEYGHGAFGTTFDRELDTWIRRHFRHVETLRGAGAAPRTLDVWIKE
jgi:hypothetical protein